MTSLRTLAKRASGLVSRVRFGTHTPPTRWVLTFHEVGTHPWAIRPQAFQQILEGILGVALVLPVHELLDSQEEGNLRVSITFDDGYLGVAKHAAPALKEAHLSATVFIPTDLPVEEDAIPTQDRGLYAGVPLMGWRTVRDLSNAYTLRFESHGAGHRALDRLSEQARLDDLRRSLERIGSVAPPGPRLLAYPFGAVDAATAATAQAVGFYAAFTTRHGSLRSGTDMLMLPRVDVRADYTSRDVLAILRGDWEFLAWRRSWRRRRS